MLSARPGTAQDAEVLVPDISQVQALMLRNGPERGECRGVVTSLALHLESPAGHLDGPAEAAAQQSRSVV
jgi:hypothetical protein